MKWFRSQVFLCELSILFVTVCRVTFMRMQRDMNALQTVLKRAYFMTVIDGVLCVGRARDKQTRDAFQSSRLTGCVRLWAVIALQTL